MRQTQTGVLERNTTLVGDFATEPMEAAWASEARWFVQVLEAPGGDDFETITQISPDGLTWCDLESDTVHTTAGVAMVSWVVHDFGGWLRIRGHAGGEGRKVRIYLVLKE